MAKNKIILFILFCFTFVPSWAKDCDHTSNRFNCVKYVKSYDGDTVTVNIPRVHPLFGKKINIRVNGVDTPEKRTKDKCEKDKARTAQKLVQSLLKKAKRIDLLNVDRGKFFRFVADVVADGQKISDVLLKNKLAYPYHGGKKQKVDWCK